MYFKEVIALISAGVYEKKNEPYMYGDFVVERGEDQSAKIGPLSRLRYRYIEIISFIIRVNHLI
jgi:hypothetical protein